MPSDIRQYSENMNLWAYLPNEGAAQQSAEQSQAGQPPLDTNGLAIKPKGPPKGMLPQQLTGTAVRSNGTGPLQLSEPQTITITASAGAAIPSEMPGLLLSMGDLRRLPHRELVTQFKCIEGWSQIVQWGGVRLADFINAYPPGRTTEGRRPRYIYMETPDGEYFCGFDMAACMHPQSLLVYEMGGQPLTPATARPCGSPCRSNMATSRSSRSASSATPTRARTTTGPTLATTGTPAFRRASRSRGAGHMISPVRY